MTVTVRQVFLSTPSARRATHSPTREATGWTHFYPRPPRGGRRHSPRIAFPHSNFYPRPPRGGRPDSDRLSAERHYFYPRPPRGGRPCPLLFFNMRFLYFYPRPPRGGRRAKLAARGRFRTISIHALREEGDCSGRCGKNHYRNFYPRPPRGGRLLTDTGGCGNIGISIHALREEGDYGRSPVFWVSRTFLSTPSARRATRYLRWHSDEAQNFYPRPP